MKNNSLICVLQLLCGFLYRYFTVFSRYVKKFRILYGLEWRRKWQLTPVFLPGKSHGQRSLVGYSSWGHKESDTTEQTHTHTYRLEMCYYFSYLSEWYIKAYYLKIHHLVYFQELINYNKWGISGLPFGKEVNNRLKEYSLIFMYFTEHYWVCFVHRNKIQ